MAYKREIVVTCSEDEGSVTRVADRLREVGFEIGNVLEFAGSISGSWSDSLDKLRELPEVDAVEVSETKHPQ
ncbi:MAG: hypothetical protein AAF802_05565 [Planctomycetota bacterium]